MNPSLSPPGPCFIRDFRAVVTGLVPALLLAASGAGVAASPAGLPPAPRAARTLAEENARIFGRIDDCRKASKGLQCDGRDGDWKGLPRWEDAAKDVEDATRDIVSVSLAPRKRDLFVLLRTRGEASVEEHAFFLEIDLVGDFKVDVRVTLRDRNGPPEVVLWNDAATEFALRPAPGSRQKRKGSMVEVQLPWAALKEALPEAVHDRLEGPKARPWVRLQAQSFGQGKTVDPAPLAASYRFEETPFALEIGDPGPTVEPIRVPALPPGKWFLNGGPWFPDLERWVYHFAQTDWRGWVFPWARERSAEAADAFSYGKAVVAPLAGRVGTVLDGVEDGGLGEARPAEGALLTGNQVDLHIEGDRILRFLYLKKGSLAVTEGEEVAAGTPLGLVGNSSSFGWPGLAFQAFDESRDPWAPLPAILENVRVSLTPAEVDPWARHLVEWLPSPGHYAESLPTSK